MITEALTTTCAGCGDSFSEDLLDDRSLCAVCDIQAYDADVKARQDAEDAELYEAGLALWGKAIWEATRESETTWLKDPAYKDLLAETEALLRSMRAEAAKAAKPAPERSPVEEVVGEPLSAFEVPLAGKEVPAPDAMLRREDGAQGQRAMRELVVGRNTQRDTIIGELVAQGLCTKTPEGRKMRYQISAWGRDMLNGTEKDC